MYIRIRKKRTEPHQRERLLQSIVATIRNVQRIILSRIVPIGSSYNRWLYYNTDKMSKIHIIPSEFNRELELQLAYSIKAGFPSPAEDYQHETLDFNRDFIKHPEATFYGRVDGDSMVDAGINDGDIAIIDRSAEASDGDVIVAFVNNEFTIKFLDISHKAEGYIELRPANKKYHPIRINDSDDFEVWGVVVWTIKNWKK